MDTDVTGTARRAPTQDENLDTTDSARRAPTQ